jgi:hypothetical protein
MTQRRTLLLVFWLTIIAAIAAWVWLQDARIADLAERCDGQRFPIEIVQGGTAPYTTLTAGAERGAFLLDYGATASTVSAESASATGERVAQSRTSTCPHSRRRASASHATGRRTQPPAANLDSSARISSRW